MLSQLQTMGETLSLVNLDLSYKMPVEYARLLNEEETSAKAKSEKGDGNQQQQQQQQQQVSLTEKSVTCVTSDPRHIVIVGAGISGLACARRLHQGTSYFPFFFFRVISLLLLGSR